MAVFSCANWRPVRNHGGAMTDQRGLVLHHAVAMGSLFARFNDPATQVSSTFWVSLGGVIEQYVDSQVVAWANGTAAANASFCSVETEGCVSPPYAQPMTTAMIDALATLYAEGHARHGWPDLLCNDPGGRGFAYHRLFYATACPCDVRLNERPGILALAFTGPTPTTEGGNMIDETPTGRGYFVARADGSCYAYGDAVYRGGINWANYPNVPEENALVPGDTCTGVAVCSSGGYWLVTAAGRVYSFGGAPFYGGAK
jgi:hypothetical protein